jgi:hypothetical protein
MRTEKHWLGLTTALIAVIVVGVCLVTVLAQDADQAENAAISRVHTSRSTPTPEALLDRFNITVDRQLADPAARPLDEVISGGYSIRDPRYTSNASSYEGNESRDSLLTHREDRMLASAAPDDRVSHDGSSSGVDQSAIVPLDSTPDEDSTPPLVLSVELCSAAQAQPMAAFDASRFSAFIGQLTVSRLEHSSSAKDHHRAESGDVAVLANKTQMQQFEQSNLSLHE